MLIEGLPYRRSKLEGSGVIESVGEGGLAVARGKVTEEDSALAGQTECR